MEKYTRSKSRSKSIKIIKAHIPVKEYGLFKNIYVWED